MPTVKHVAMRGDNRSNFEDHAQTGLANLIRGYFPSRPTDNERQKRAPINNIHALASTVTRRAVIDSYRKSPDSKTPIPVDNIEAVFGERSTGPSAEEEVLNGSKERIGMLFEQAGLSERTSKILLLRYVEGRSVAETAQILGCPEGTVKSGAFAGLKRLRDLLDPDNPADRKGDLFEKMLERAANNASRAD